MTTIENIIEYSKPHPNGLEGGRQTVLTDGKIIMSIVGGARGLYGDFKENFEVAIIDSETRNFITPYYVTSADNDVIGYMGGDELVKLVDTIFVKGFQVQ